LSGIANQTRLVGYARVSTSEQSVQMQVDALLKAGVHRDNIHTESVSGVSRRRPALERAYLDLQEGDTLVVYKLDRVGRSLLDLLDRIKRLEAMGCGFWSLSEKIDTTTPGGRLLMHVMGALAQFERDLIVERTREGVRAHIARGGKIGAETKMTADKVQKAHKMLSKNRSVAEVAKTLKVSTGTIYNYFPGGLRGIK
jgi:DNA invertase Pin-like site-specific DNA recombinase